MPGNRQLIELRFEDEAGKDKRCKDNELHCLHSKDTVKDWKIETVQRKIQNTLSGKIEKLGEAGRKGYGNSLFIIIHGSSSDSNEVKC